MGTDAPGSSLGEVIENAMKELNARANEIGWDQPPMFCLLAQHEGTVFVAPVPAISVASTHLERPYEAMLGLLAVEPPPFDTVLAAMFMSEAWMLSGDADSPAVEAELAAVTAERRLKHHPRREEVRMIHSYGMDGVVRFLQHERLFDRTTVASDEEVDALAGGIVDCLIVAGRHVMGLET